jgi:hypothetical protein
MNKYYFMWRDEDTDKVTLYKKNMENRHDDEAIASVRLSEHLGVTDAEGNPHWDVLENWIKTVTDDPEALEYDWG